MAANVANYESFEGINEGIQQTYNASAGTDILATIDGVLIGNLNGISFSTTREKAPIYVMGSVDAVSFGRGKRGHAGSLIFTNFDRHALYDIMENSYGSSNSGQEKRYQYFRKETDVPAGGRSMFLNTAELDAVSSLTSSKAPANYSDQIPPFTVSLTSMNEYGSISVMHILGVELINEGSGVSIDDIVIETQMTFVARAILGWRPLRATGSEQRVQQDTLGDLNNLTAVRQAEVTQSLPFA